MEILGQIKQSMPFLLLHRHAFFRALRMNLQRPGTRASRNATSLHVIVKEDPIVNSLASGSLHVLLSRVSTLKKLVQNLINFTLLSTRDLHLAKQMLSQQVKANFLHQFTNKYLNIGCQQILMYRLREFCIRWTAFVNICRWNYKQNKHTKLIQFT